MQFGTQSLLYYSSPQFKNTSKVLVDVIQSLNLPPELSFKLTFTKPGVTDETRIRHFNISHVVASRFNKVN